MDERLKEELELILEGKELKDIKQEYIRKYAPKYGLLGAWLLWKQIEREALTAKNGR